MLNASANLPTPSRAVLSVAAPFRRADAEGLPQRVRILKWGENIGRTTGARILVDDKVTATLSANQELVAIETVPMDYEHQSVKGHPNYLADPRLSPGSGKIEVVPGEGVFLSAITYSKNGAEHADSYQDVSAVVHLDADGRPLWVSSVALTQTGDVAGMEFSEAVAVLSARSGAPPKKSELEQSPTPKPTDQMENKDNVFRSLLIKFLGLKPGESGEVTDEEITAAAEAKATAPAAESTAALTAVPTADTIAALTARLDAAERAELVRQAGREGKVIPLSAEQIAETSIATLSAIVSGLPAGEVHTDTKAHKEKPADKVVALSADESAMASKLGLTEDEYRAAQA